MNGKCRYNTYNANGRLAETHLEMSFNILELVYFHYVTMINYIVKINIQPKLYIGQYQTKLTNETQKNTDCENMKPQTSCTAVC